MDSLRSPGGGNSIAVYTPSPWVTGIIYGPDLEGLGISTEDAPPAAPARKRVLMGNR